jgi:hypothetical protein
MHAYYRNTRYCLLSKHKRFAITYYENNRITLVISNVNYRNITKVHISQQIIETHITLQRQSEHPDMSILTVYRV